MKRTLFTLDFNSKVCKETKDALKSKIPWLFENASILSLVTNNGIDFWAEVTDLSTMTKAMDTLVKETELNKKGQVLFTANNVEFNIKLTFLKS